MLGGLQLHVASSSQSGMQYEFLGRFPVSSDTEVHSQALISNQSRKHLPTNESTDLGCQAYATLVGLNVVECQYVLQWPL